MNINTNIQSFSSQSGIKVTQNGNSNQSIDKNKNSEAVNININIDSKTLDTLNLLSFLGEETILKARLNGYVNNEAKLARERLEEVYSKATKENKKFANPEQHISDKYYSQPSPYYIEGLSRMEREIAYNHEMDYLKNNKLTKINYIDPNLKDLTSIHGYIEELEEKKFNREAVNTQFQQLLDKYSISIPKDTNLTFTIDPYDYKVSVGGLEDKSLSSLIEDALNTASNSKELFSHIYNSTLDNNSQVSKEKSDKKTLFHEIKNRTGYDLRDLENIDGKFLTQDGTDILELYKIGVINSKNIPEEYKGMVFELYSGKLIELAKKGFENIEDLNLSIDYKNGSFYDLGQSENFGTGKTKWIDELKASKSKTFGEAFKDYRKDIVYGENSQDIIKDALNLKEFSFKGIKSEADSLLEKYGSKDMELIKLLLMQKYLMGKEDSESDKEFYKLLKEWEESKNQE
ncbi:DUF4885 domain-containing protein [Aliarcobacter cryaerophilus]|uniref:DUF4885 domain-containing protein n=1 Tax=Aliarcobacter cryaerophilus TaxID=28198 RepID=UPI0021B4EAD4|nr:DUF4885 domain-containing protein [Aliarcobacter cryaerophilus]MCT7473717.1 DUF4885 domain-containing protein [Aliarcobacter cryaerophilus]MCT7540962.1 DUF4885 domain-containing protein [Aliarcobacter cryaerophilus]